MTQHPGIARQLRAQLMMRDAQVRYADVVVVAGSAQRSLLLDELDRVGDARPTRPRIVTVPFGVPDPPERPTGRPLRAAFPEIGRHDPVVLWWGKVWKWFDAETAIRAFARVVERRPDARLVITAGKSPKAEFDVSNQTRDARELSQSLGLLGRNAFFLDEWTPYDSRHEYLLDADVGLTLHGNTAEAPFAARARYMDYLWSALPCVLASGDETASTFGEAGFASLVAPGDVDGPPARFSACSRTPPRGRPPRRPQHVSPSSIGGRRLSSRWHARSQTLTLAPDATRSGACCAPSAGTTCTEPSTTPQPSCAQPGELGGPRSSDHGRCLTRSLSGSRLGASANRWKAIQRAARHRAMSCKPLDEGWVFGYDCARRSLSARFEAPFRSCSEREKFR